MYNTSIMRRNFFLLTHPPLAEIAEQLVLPSDAEKRYGEYTVQRPGVSLLDKSVRNWGEVFAVLHIAPNCIERVSSKLGALTIYGVTRQGEAATVGIDPFSQLDSIGTIVVEGE